MVFIERIRVPGLRDFNISIGSRMPVDNTAAGKAVLAYLEQEKFKEIIQEIKEDSQAARYIGKNGNRLTRLLNEVSRNRFAIDDEESSKGIRAIAVPFFSPDGVTCAMDMIVAPEEISVNELRTKYAPILIRAGKEISGALGWQQASNTNSS
jgi:DNA-binding IclR family transcriptional regulator